MRLSPPWVVVAAVGLSLAAVMAQATDQRPALMARLDADLRIPADNPPTEAAVALGRRLFFDPVLSGTGTHSCGSCHDPTKSFADDHAVAVGIMGRKGTRNTPSIVNRAYGDVFFWDGRAATLEAQVIKPIENPDELGSAIPQVVATLARDRGYAEAFRGAFGRGPDAAGLARALASYVRTIQSGDAPADQAASGNPQALSPLAQRGARVFRIQGLCVTCHAGPNFTDEKFHNTGVSWDGRAFADLGRFLVTKVERDRGAFKTPTLRDVARTGPYMHDGSFSSLDEVVEFYAGGGRPNPYLDSEMLPLRLTDQDKQALVKFLEALTGTVTEGRLGGPARAAPRAARAGR